MDNNKDLFEGMILFCAVVEYGSLTAAARQFGHTQSHVSKMLARLEARLGTRLLHRTTRKIGLTESGRVYYENARRVVAETRLVEERLQALGDRPYGELKMSVPVIFAQGCFSGWVAEFLHTCPDVSLHVDVSDRLVDLVAEGFDLVVRIGHLPDSNLVARELFRTPVSAIAAAGYLDSRETPEHPHDLSDHHLISFTGEGAVLEWDFTDTDGSRICVRAPAKVRCNEAGMERALLLAGAGIARVPAFAYEEELARRELVRVLTRFEQPPIGVHLIYPNRDHMPPKTRAMADFMLAKTRSFRHPDMAAREITG